MRDLFLKSALTVALTGLVSTLLAGCVQFPTEKQGIVDMRPAISFKLVTEQGGEARVLLDGLDVGPAGTYAEGVAALRVLPGNHQLTIVRGNQILLQDRFYIGEGVSRSLSVQ